MNMKNFTHNINDMKMYLYPIYVWDGGMDTKEKYYN